jgi:hypothetical protein
MLPYPFIGPAGAQNGGEAGPITEGNGRDALLCVRTMAGGTAPPGGKSRILPKPIIVNIIKLISRWKIVHPGYEEFVV